MSQADINVNKYDYTVNEWLMVMVIENKVEEKILFKDW